jgi:hypothetical protein
MPKVLSRRSIEAVVWNGRVRAADTMGRPLRSGYGVSLAGRVLRAPGRVHRKKRRASRAAGLDGDVAVLGDRPDEASAIFASLRQFRLTLGKPRGAVPRGDV